MQPAKNHASVIKLSMQAFAQCSLTCSWTKNRDSKHDQWATATQNRQYLSIKKKIK